MLASPVIGADGRVELMVPGWDGFRLNGLLPVVEADGTALPLTEVAVDGVSAVYTFGERLRLALAFHPVTAGWELTARLRNDGPATVLNRVFLLRTAKAAFSEPADVRVLVQTAYSGDVVSLGQSQEALAAAEPGSETTGQGCWSSLVSVIYDRQARRTLLTGFLTSERWLGIAGVQADAEGTVTEWNLGFDGGDLLIDLGSELPLETAVLLAGSDPFALLEQYGDLTAARFPVVRPEAPPVSWCSWYPYRLGVTEERLLENARAGVARLGALGFRIVETDLGWEEAYLPSAFTENAQFPHGLSWLADQLTNLGLELGVWKAPYTISAFDPLATEHPEWLIQGEDGRPEAYWTWYWEPFGDVYILDLTHPGAQGWLRERMESLHARGVTYFKADFIGCVGEQRAKRRHDPRVVLGGGCEGARLGARIIREALPGALQLVCGGPEAPGTGQWPLLYQCMDTGNTGIITWEFHRRNYRGVATHLWKNGRWGWIQPSCLCVGLPGTLEEARLRATAAFLAGGQIDISDTLTTLPEDRWDILRATLPVLGQSARAVDLFDPLPNPAGGEHPPGIAWHLPLSRGEDAWHLLGLFNFDSTPAGEPPALLSAAVPLDRLGLPAETRLWAYEFWSGQFLGELPALRHNAGGYTHPGDWQDLSVGDTPGVLECTFAGPAVKLLCLRPARPHPWLVGSRFYQGCGAEIDDLHWDADARVLSGVLVRPAGEMGDLTLATAGLTACAAEVDGRPAPLAPAAAGAVRLPLITTAARTPWQVCFAP